METKKIKIIVKEREMKDANGKVKKFNTYKTVSKNGRFLDVKFRKEVTNLPTQNCYAIIDIDKMNVDKNREYPVLWVSAVESYESIEANTVEQNREKINEMF